MFVAVGVLHAHVPDLVGFDLAFNHFARISPARRSGDGGQVFADAAAQLMAQECTGHATGDHAYGTAFAFFFGDGDGHDFAAVSAAHRRGRFGRGRRSRRCGAQLGFGRCDGLVVFGLGITAALQTRGRSGFVIAQGFVAGVAIRGRFTVGGVLGFRGGRRLGECGAGQRR